MILVNKADGDLLDVAKHSVADYTSALRMLRPASPNWTVPVLPCSAMNGSGLDEAWKRIEAFRKTLGDSGEIDRRRSAQALDWLWTEVGEGLIAALKQNADIRAALPSLERGVADGKVPPAIAARRLINTFSKSS